VPASADQAGGGTPTPAQPVAPAGGGTVSGLEAATDSGGNIELVWAAPAQASPVRFFVQLLALDPAGPPREVFAAYLDETATLAPLERAPGRYAWRVYSVSRDLRHYAASEWQRFQVAAQD
jgi:hypothetical protein